jgi:hypothetical protein
MRIPPRKRRNEDVFTCTTFCYKSQEGRYKAVASFADAKQVVVFETKSGLRFGAELTAAFQGVAVYVRGEHNDVEIFDDEDDGEPKNPESVRCVIVAPATTASAPSLTNHQRSSRRKKLTPP